MRKQRYLMLGLLAGLFLVFTPACGSDDGDGDTDGGTDGGQQTGFQQPDDTVPLYFSIDASQRSGEFQDGDLEWKGQFTYDDTTRLMTYSDDWAGGNGPYAPLYDDGPWTAGGHEPEGATADDGIFGIAAFLPVPGADLLIHYGAQTADGGWIWVGDDGAVTVPAGATDAITAQGMTLLPSGTVDIKVTLDTNNLGSDFAFDSTVQDVELKGTFTDWDPAELAYDDGTHGDDTADDGVYTYVLSQSETEHELVASGTTQEWVWVFDDGTDEAEYKDADTAAEKTGVMVYTKGPDDTDWVDQTSAIFITSGFGSNTAIEIP